MNDKVEDFLIQRLDELEAKLDNLQETLDEIIEKLDNLNQGGRDFSIFEP